MSAGPGQGRYPLDIIHKIARTVISLILSVNIIIFGFIAWPAGITARDLKHSGMPVVIAAVRDIITPGEIYELDTDQAVVKAVIYLDVALYSQTRGHLVALHPDWKTYVITGDLARQIMRKTHAFAFTDPINHIIIFLAVSGADPKGIISHEFVHALQTEDGIRLAQIPRLLAEYEAEFISRIVVSLTPGLEFETYPVHHISKLEKLEIRKYLAYKDL